MMRLFNVWLFILWLNVDESLQQGDVTCKEPVIPNGFVTERKQDYYEDDVLHFECNNKYKRIEDRPSRCIKTGQRADWSPTPGCEPIKCSLKLPPVRGTSYTPQYTNLFPPGDSVTVRCGDTYGITDRQAVTADVLCKEDGEWEIQPVCQEVTCLKRGSHVYYWYNTWRARIHETAYYRCEPGYKKPHDVTRATCARGGWSPDPLCEEMRCLPRQIPNTNLLNHQQHYTDRQQAHYVCKNGFKGEFLLTCMENGWSGDDRCVEIICDRRIDPNADFVDPKPDTRYKDNEQVHYICKKNQQRYTLTCGKEGWVGSSPCPESTCSRHDDPAADIRYPKPVYNYNDQAEYVCKEGGECYTLTCKGQDWVGESKCSAIKCPKDEVQNGFIVGPVNDTFYYSCNEGYKPLRGGWWGAAKCDGTQWVGLHQCIDKTGCRPPEIPNAKVTPPVPDTGFYANKEHVQITCNEHYTSESTELTCRDGKWDKNPKVICKQADRYCTAPPKVENAFLTTPYQKNYLSGSEVTYQCHHGLKVEGDGTIRCQNGVWEQTDITCTQPTDCGTPPPLPDGDIRYAIRSQYNHSEQVEYMCQTLYTMEGEPYRTCEDGEWTGHMRCLKPCILNVDDIRQNNIAVKSSYKMFLLHDEVVEFRCSTGKPTGSLAMRQRCNSGTLSLPSCS